MSTPQATSPTLTAYERAAVIAALEDALGDPAAGVGEDSLVDAMRSALDKMLAVGADGGGGPLLVPLWPDAGKALGFGRTKTFEVSASGELETVKHGRKRLVPVVAIHAFVDRLRAECRTGATR